MSKQESLGSLKKRMLADKGLPLRAGATQLVFGEGNSDSEIYFLGEAPGYYEDKQGRPFVGLAGKLLDKLIEGIGLFRRDVYISNVVRYRPPGNRDPEPEEIEAFAPYVDEEIKIVDPKIIVTLGRFSMRKFLPDARISVVHGKMFNTEWAGGKRLVIPMYHPAAALRSSDILKKLTEDFEVIKKALEGEAESSKEEIKKEPSQLSLI